MLTENEEGHIGMAGIIVIIINNRYIGVSTRRMISNNESEDRKTKAICDVI